MAADDEWDAYSEVLPDDVLSQYRALDAERNTSSAQSMRGGLNDDPDRPWPDVNIVWTLETAGASASLGRLGQWQDGDGLHFDRHGHLLALELKGWKRAAVDPNTRRRSSAQSWPVARVAGLIAQQLRRGMLLYVGYDAYFAELNASEVGGVTTQLSREAQEQPDARQWPVNVHYLDRSSHVVVVDARDLVEAAAERVTFNEPFAVETTWERVTVDLPRAFNVAGASCGCGGPDAEAVCRQPAHFDWRAVLTLADSTG